MSNEIAERTIESRYIIKVQNGHLDFIPMFAIFMQKREFHASAHFSFMDGATASLLTNKRLGKTKTTCIMCYIL